MIPGDERGEPIPLTYPRQEPEDIAWGALSKIVGGGFTMLGPVGTLLGFAAAGWGLGKVGQVGKWGLSVTAAVGKWGFKTALRTPGWAARIAPTAIRTAGWAGVAAAVPVVGAGAISAFGALGIGLGARMVVGAGIKAYARHPVITGAALTGAALGAGAFMGWRGQHEQQRAQFVDAANGYMARGAAGRNRSQGHDY